MAGIQDQIDQRIAELRRAFAERTGIDRVLFHFSAKRIVGGAKPEIHFALLSGWGDLAAKVSVYTHDLGDEPTIDAAFALAEQRIAALRTIEDENADLGIVPPAPGAWCRNTTEAEQEEFRERKDRARAAADMVP